MLFRIHISNMAQRSAARAARIVEAASGNPEVAAHLQVTRARNSLIARRRLNEVLTGVYADFCSPESDQ